eukprot:COSAG04_NODE_270_length_18507_cov_125.250380_8_plen_121_part_00
MLLPRAQSVAKDGVLPLLQGDPNSADLATSRVKDILEDLLRSARRPALSRQLPAAAGWLPLTRRLGARRSTESSDNISRIRAEARAEVSAAAFLQPRSAPAQPRSRCGMRAEPGGIVGIC